MKSLYVIDGSNMLFRAYHGLPVLTNHDDMPVHAVFGMAKMVMKLLLEQPDYLVIAWDAPHKTIRHVMYEDYKANRSSAPDDLKWQIGQTKELLGQMRVPALETPGYEADDLIASVVARFAADEDMYIRIVTSDKDMKQLISPRVVCYDAMKDKVTDEQLFVEEFGFAPPLMCDYLALVGDSSDNIPGVKGIGHKGALTLIGQYGSLETLYERLDDLKPSYRDKLVAGRESAFASKKLVELMLEPSLAEVVPAVFAWDVDWQQLEEVLLKQWEFASCEKLLRALKNKYTMPQQVGLF